MVNNIPSLSKVGSTISTNVEGSETEPSVTGFLDGSFSIAYSGSYRRGNGAGGYNTYSRVSVSDLSTFTGSTSVLNYSVGVPSITTLSGFNTDLYALTWEFRKRNSGTDIILRRPEQKAGWTTDNQVYGNLFFNVHPYIRVNSVSQGNHLNPAITPTSEGGLIVTWQSDITDGSGNGIMAVRYDQNFDVAWESPINNYILSEQQNPAIIALNSPTDTNKDGINDAAGFVVAWQSKGQDGSDWGIYALRYDEQNNPLGSEFRVNSTTTHAQEQPALTPLINGGFLVFWQSDQQDGSGYGIFAQRYDTLGNRVGAEFQVNTYTDLDQTNVAATTLSDGSVVVTWQSQAQDGSGYGIYAQMFDMFGNRIGEEFKVNTFSANDQTLPTIAKRGNDGFIIAWQGEFIENDPIVQAQMYTWPGYAPPAFAINNDLQIPENGGVAKLTVTLSEPIATIVYVSWETVDNTARAYLDYVPQEGQLEFKPGDTSKIIEVPILNDTNDERDENFYIYLKNALTNNIIDPLSIVTIQPPVNTEVLVQDVTVNEGAGKATLTFTLSEPNANLITVDYSTTDDKALKDFDYIAKTGTIEFQPGETQKSLDIEIRNDDIVESDERVLVNLTNPRFTTLRQDVVAITIEDNDVDNQPPYVVRAIPDISQGDFTQTRIFLPDYFADAETDNLSFAIEGSYAKSIRPEVTGNYLIIDYLDYVTTSLSIKAIDQEDATVIDTFNINITRPPGDEFELNNSPNDATLLTPVKGVITANDLSIHTVTDVDYFRFNLPQVGTQNNLVRIDFQSSLGDLDLDLYQWDTSKWSLARFSNSDGDQEVISLLGLTSGDYLVKVFGFNSSSNENYDLTINVGVSQESTNLSINASNAVQIEGNSGTKAFSFTVTRSSNTTGISTANWAVTGTGTNPANAGDFGGTLPSGTVTFAAGVTSQIITVNVSGDTVVEQEETFTVSLSNPSNAILTTATATGTIRNDDTPLVQGDRQQIRSLNNVTTTPGGNLSIPLFYNTSTGDNTLTGISVRLHYNSTELTFNGTANLFDTSLFGDISDNVDNGDFDNDANTDRYLQFQYTDFAGNWPNQPLPLKLGDFSFTASEKFAATQINFTSNNLAPGYNLQADSIFVDEPNWNLDIDGNGKIQALSDGIMAVRYIFGAAFDGDKLTEGAIAPDATRTREEIAAYLQEGIDNLWLDIDGNGKIQALSDGIMAVRYIFGAAFDGDKLIEGAIAPDATRNLTQIQTHLALLTGKRDASPWLLDMGISR